MICECCGRSFQKDRQPLFEDYVESRDIQKNLARGYSPDIHVRRKDSLDESYDFDKSSNLRDKNMKRCCVKCGGSFSDQEFSTAEAIPGAIPGGQQAPIQNLKDVEAAQRKLFDSYTSGLTQAASAITLWATRDGPLKKQELRALRIHFTTFAKTITAKLWPKKDEDN